MTTENSSHGTEKGGRITFLDVRLSQQGAVFLVHTNTASLDQVVLAVSLAQTYLPKNVLITFCQWEEVARTRFILDLRFRTM